MILVNDHNRGRAIHDRPALLLGLVNHPVVPSGPTDGKIRHFLEQFAWKDKIVAAGRQVKPAARLDIRPQALIPRHIEPQVVEVYGDGVGDWARDCGQQRSERCEPTGETVFCYLREPAQLIATLKEWPQLRYLHRPANLEDVFLKLTGRELRD